MKRNGFTLIELMVAVLVIGIIAAVTIPCYASMMDRAREASTKCNMHGLQLMAEDYLVRNNYYPELTKEVLGGTQDNFSGGGPGALLRPPVPGTPGGPFLPNPWTGIDGEGASWENRAGLESDPSDTPGVVSYAGTADRTAYNIKGRGAKEPLSLVLTNTN